MKKTQFLPSPSSSTTGSKNSKRPGSPARAAAAAVAMLLVCSPIHLPAQTAGLEGTVNWVDVQVSREPSGQLRLYPSIGPGDLGRLAGRLHRDLQVHIRITYSAESSVSIGAAPYILAIRDRIVLYDPFQRVYAIRDIPGTDEAILRSQREFEEAVFDFPSLPVSQQYLEPGDRITIAVTVEPAEPDRGLWFLNPFRPRESTYREAHTEVPF